MHIIPHNEGKQFVQVKTQVKEALAFFASRSSAPVIVNSFGRSGSTVCTDGIVQSANRLGEWTDRHVIRAEAWNLATDRVKPGRVYKTHDYPTRTLRTDARIIYIFGDPVAATYSLLERTTRWGTDWLDRHADHLKVPRFQPTGLLHRDALAIEQHLSAWLRQKHHTVAFVRYDALWDKADELSEFLGSEVQMPPRRQRESAPSSTMPVDTAVYARASEIVSSLPDWQVRLSATSGSEIVN